MIRELSNRENDISVRTEKGQLQEFVSNFKRDVKFRVLNTSDEMKLGFGIYAKIKVVYGRECSLRVTIS